LTGFQDDFRALTGLLPLDWQIRLYEDFFAKGVLPVSVDVPTGLGKTMVMVLWLIARARGVTLPRRLVYVVDRRAVVDQATAEAEKLCAALAGEAEHIKRTSKGERTATLRIVAELKGGLGLYDGKLPISTLRGQFIDNREWLDDPAGPAIIVGTVDMTGSRMLFGGYGVSRKMRPFHAGLLGVDTLVVLDEAHLVPPFAHLLTAIERDAALWPKAEADLNLLPPFAMLPLSATQRGEADDAAGTGRMKRAAPFRLEPADWQGDDIARKRLNATKRLTLRDLDGKEADAQLAEVAWALATGGEPKRVVVFCDRRDKDDEGQTPTAQGVTKAIEALAKGDRKKDRPKTDIEEPVLLVGARRGRERKKAADRLGALGFTGEPKAVNKPTFLIATSAGEVGVDIDADHMVSDLVPWERMVQRLGRVNRKGNGAAEACVFWSEPTVKKADAPTPAERRAAIAHRVLGLIRRLPCDDASGFDSSPGALRRLADDPAAKAAIAAATTPDPLYPALNRPLADSWAMTALEIHTGRPEVGPWLRGWEDDPRAQTTLAWRCHLPASAPEGNAAIGEEDINAFFEAAQVREAETLETESRRASEWLRRRAAELAKHGSKRAPDDEGEPDADAVADDATADTGKAKEASTRPLGERDVAAICLSQRGEFGFRILLGELLREERRKGELERRIAGMIVVLDARFGGLDGSGTLDEKAEGETSAGDAGSWDGIGFRVVLETVKGDGEWTASDAERPVPGERLVHSLVVRRGPDGEPGQRLAVYSAALEAGKEDAKALSKTRPQTLAEHEAWAEAQATAIADTLGLTGDAWRTLTLAARLHDEGKKAKNWQNAFKAARDAKTFGLTGPLAKTRGPIDQALLGGYRHEFGSLPYAEVDADVGRLPEGWRDLVLHLIAAHHGGARPVIETRGCDDAPPSALEGRVRAVALRFARLQRRWGPWGLAWWESLLRAADQRASRALDALDVKRGSEG